MVWIPKAHRLTCEATGARHIVQVATPPRYDLLPDRQWPVVVVMDGQWLFGTVKDATRIMAFDKDAPEAIVVGVSFDEDNPAELVRERARWYSPTAWVPPPEVGAGDIDASSAGRALELAHFLTHQVLPMIDAGLRTNDARWFVGHSFSALFGLRVLLDQPDLFSRLLFMSPSVWWDSRAILDMEATSDWAGAARSPERIFVTVGEDEYAAPFNMKKNAEELVERLQQRCGADAAVGYAVQPGTNHSSSVFNAICTGLRFLNES